MSFRVGELKGLKLVIGESKIYKFQLKLGSNYCTVVRKLIACDGIGLLIVVDLNNKCRYIMIIGVTDSIHTMSPNNQLYLNILIYTLLNLMQDIILQHYPLPLLKMFLHYKRRVT